MSISTRLLPFHRALLGEMPAVTASIGVSSFLAALKTFDNRSFKPWLASLNQGLNRPWTS
jgi:hypothetical protein